MGSLFLEEFTEKVITYLNDEFQTLPYDFIENIMRSYYMGEASQIICNFQKGALTEEDIDIIIDIWQTSNECGAFTHYKLSLKPPSKDIIKNTTLAFTEEELDDILESDDDEGFNYDLLKDNEGQVYKFGKYYIIEVYFAHG